MTSSPASYSSPSSSGSSSDDSTDADDDIATAQVLLEKPAKKKRTRRSRPHEPKANAPWQRMLDEAENPGGCADPNSIDGKYFRRRFRVPYSLFKAMIKVMLDDVWFPGDFEQDGQGKCCKVGRQGASLQVKVLSVLRVLGRGICFDEAYDGSGLSETVNSRFYHRFCSIFVQRCV